MLISAPRDLKPRQMSFGTETHNFQPFPLSMVQIPTVSLIRCPRALKPIPIDSARVPDLVENAKMCSRMIGLSLTVFEI